MIKELYEAIGAGDPARVAALLAAGADPNGEVDTAPDDPEAYDSRVSMVEAACGRGDLAILDLLADAGGDIERPDHRGITLIYRASSWPDPSVALWLLRRGARPAPPNPWGWCALQNATSPALIRALVAVGASPDGLPGGMTPLACAEARGDTDAAALLRTLGAKG